MPRPPARTSRASSTTLASSDWLRPVAGNGLLDRRALLERGLVFAVAAVAPRPASAQTQDAPRARPADATPQQPGARPQWMREPGAPFSNYGYPSPYERAIVRSPGTDFARDLPVNGAAWTPLESLEGMITPNGLHFVRNHDGTPNVDPAVHRLVIHGRVRRPLAFDRAALERYPQRSQIVALECAGNSSSGWFEEPVQRALGLTHGLVSCSEWTGVPLALLLAEAGADPRAGWVIAGGADAAAMNMSVPLGPPADDAMIALAQNGEPLRPENGYPMRLLVPGCRGVVSVKWLRTLQVADAPAMTRNETARYTELLPSGKARQFDFVMPVKSFITSPSHGQSLQGRGLYQISGLAWSGRGRIAKVEVSADGGESYAQAALEGPVLPRSFTRFRAAWAWDGKPCVLQSRATDETGDVQPTRAALVAARGRRAFYHYHAIVSWDVDRNGYVSHTYV